MTTIEAMSIIHNAEKLGSIMGVETVKEMLNRLGNPQDQLKVIHIAGTNGKGSTLAMVSTILTTAGYKTGRYISPTLVSYYERFQINGEFISEEAFTQVMDEIKPVYDSMVNEGYTPTAFEIETVIAFLYFKNSCCDFAVIETGMGGTYDATNVISHPLCCVFASIGLDHMGILGDTIEKIAENKAGIIKENTYVISAKQEQSVLDVLRNKCDLKNSPLIIANPEVLVSDVCIYPNELSFTYKNCMDISLSLNGSYQIINACTAISCIEVLQNLGYNVTNTDITKGIASTYWFGRLTRIGLTPEFYVDGAHNKPAALELGKSIKYMFSTEYLAGRKLVYIMGVFADKDYNSIIDITIPYADHIFTIATPDNVRAMPADILAEHINSRNNIATSCIDINDAVYKAITYNSGKVLVVAFGSLSHLNIIRNTYIDLCKQTE